MIQGKNRQNLMFYVSLEQHTARSTSALLDSPNQNENNFEAF